MKEQGNIVELKFMAKAMGLGIAVSLPFGDNQPYDCITDRNGLSRVQIKSSSRIDRSSRLNAYNVLVSHGSNNKIKYTEDDCDIIAIYIIPQDSWYIIPIDFIAGKTVKLYPHVDNEKEYKYEIWREKWNLL